MEGMPQVNLRRPVVGGCVQEPRRIDSDGLPAFPRGSTSINTEDLNRLRVKYIQNLRILRILLIFTFRYL